MAPADINRELEDAFDRHMRGDIAFAGGVYRRILSQHPNHPRALHYLGLLAQQGGSPNTAIKLLQRSIEIDPTDPGAHNHLGQLFISLNDQLAAAASFERGLKVDPDNVALLNNLANLILTQDVPRAIALLRRALVLNPTSPAVTFGLAQALNRDHSFDEAVELYKRTLDLDPKHIHARQNLGLLLEQRGRFAEAIDQYLTVQKYDQNNVQSLANVLALRDFVADPPMVMRAEQTLRTVNLNDVDRIKLHRGLGKHYERAGSYEQAFSHFTKAKVVFKRSRPAFEINAVADVMTRLKQVYRRDFFTAKTIPITSSARPVFIVGLHRSGTTLAEQIIASHPKVFGAGELHDVGKLTKSLRPHYPECMTTLDSSTLAELARGYLETISNLAGVDALRVTDKMPLNSLHLGFIATLFPNAYIIYCRRDPLDIAVSCYVELIDLYHDYTTDFVEFGQYFLEHEKLMDHWRNVLPISIHELRYEELVATPEAVSRSLIGYCELDWHPACLQFHTTERTVQTPSRWQVRQPVYQSSIGRWKNYRSHLTGLINLLDAAGYKYTADQTRT